MLPEIVEVDGIKIKESNIEALRGCDGTLLRGSSVWITDKGRIEMWDNRRFATFRVNVVFKKDVVLKRGDKFRITLEVDAGYGLPPEQQEWLLG